MKRIMKKVLVALPVLVVLATVGLVSVGCDDSTTSGGDMAAKDLSTKG